jgi:pyruvate,orthophosphate dikinase
MFRAMSYVYAFSEGSSDMRSLLGGKGAGLAEMLSLGIPVTDGFTVTTEACIEASHANGVWPEGLADEIDEALEAFEQRVGLGLGDAQAPLLVSVRSGAVVSMPGMMDTILNLGLNDEAVVGLAKASGNARFALDSYRRLLQMFGNVVEGVESHLFEDVLARAKRERDVKNDVDLDEDALAEVVRDFQKVYADGAGHPFPQDPREQLRLAISAVFASWDSPRAKVYRRASDISDSLGTAVNICQMVFGNLGDSSGTGVCFSRDPSTGERVLYGEFLRNAQGEDVVAGIRTPEPIARMAEQLPQAYDQLVETVERLEQHYGDMQDVEFTVERGALYLLQTRSGKRTAAAAIRIARELEGEGVIDRDEAVRRVDPNQLDALLHPRIDPGTEYETLARGLNASPGAATGAAVFDADTAERRGLAGEQVILIRWETAPDDIHGLLQAQGVVTAHGGMTSHAAVVARGMGKPCVAGVEAARIDQENRTLTMGVFVLREWDVIKIVC